MCLSAILTNLQPCICGKMCLAARKGYVCSKTFLLPNYSPRAQGEGNRMADVASNIPSRDLSWKHDVPQVTCSYIREGPYLRWVEGEIHEAVSTYHVCTQPSLVENDSDLVFSSPTMWTNPIPPVWMGNDAGEHPEKWAGRQRLQQLEGLAKLCLREMLYTKRQHPD